MPVFEVTGSIEVEVYTVVEAETAEDAIKLAGTRKLASVTSVDSAMDKWVLDELDGPVSLLSAEIQ